MIKDTWEIATAGVLIGNGREDIEFPNTQLEQPPNKYLGMLYNAVGQTAHASTEIVSFSVGFLWGIVKEIGNMLSLLWPGNLKKMWDSISGFVKQVWELVKEKGVSIDQILGVVFDSIGNIPKTLRQQWDTSNNFNKGSLTAATVLSIIPASKRKQAVKTLQNGVVELEKLLKGINKGDFLVGNNGKLMRADGKSFFNEVGGVRKGTTNPLKDFIKNVKTKTFNVLEEYKSKLYSPKFGQNPRLKGKIINENNYYKLADNDPLLFDAEYITKKYNLTKIRHSVGELPDLLKKADADSEILYVLKENGELVFSIRSKSSSYLPHPVLSKGQGVKVAGTLEKQGNVWVVTNDSGHFQPSAKFEPTKMGKLLKAVSDKINQVHNLDLTEAMKNPINK